MSDNTTPEWFKSYFTLLDNRLSAIVTSINTLQQEIKVMALDLTALTNQVAATESVEESAITLITELAGEIQASANDPAALAALGARLQNSAASLAAAVVANAPPAANTANT